MTRVAEREKSWLQRAVRLNRQINLAWYFQTLAGPLLIFAAIGSFSTILLRRQFSNIDPLTLWLSVLVLLWLLATVCFLVAKKRFESPDESLIRLESRLELNSALSAAKQGVSTWPQQSKDSEKLLRWHLPKTIIPPTAALLLLALGLLIPISPKVKVSELPSNQPQAWSELDSQLQQLAEDAMVDQEYIEEMEERLAELRAQEEEDWFSHASLEATDSLTKSQNSNLEKLAQDLASAKDALDSLSQKGGNKTAEQQQKLADDFENALEGLKNGEMKPNPKLLDQLSNLDPKNLKKLTPEQLAQLKANMKDMQQVLGEMQDGEFSEAWSDQLLAGEGGEDQGNFFGAGDITRCPGHDPDVLRGEKDQLPIGELAALDATDLSRAAPGDLLELQEEEHQVDQSKSKASSGGQAAKGKGGDRIWKDSLAPDEQRALKKYFE